MDAHGRAVDDARRPGYLRCPMKSHAFRVHEDGDVPLVAAAVHDGHDLRDEVARRVRLSEAERLREEDPFTGEWTTITGHRLVALRSRFEVDLNRPRDRAVYRKPEDAWGLDVWQAPPPDDLLARSLAVFDEFYAAAERLLSNVQRRFSRFVVYDLHSYNHRRDGPEGPPADPEGNPEVNVGTGSMDRERWAPVVEAFLTSLRGFDLGGGRRLDVRENVKFQGGQFSRWVHETYPDTGCSMAIEFKKTFMDEWTGRPDRQQMARILRALEGTVPAVLEALRGM